LAAVRSQASSPWITLGTASDVLYLNGLLVPPFSLSRYQARPHLT
jgi:hypothetical protein